jgi:V/A-type H+/Na+-transporting ATPase subunit E
MSIESITERILKEANAYSEDQRTQAEAVKKSVLDEAKQQADEVIAKYTAEAEKAAATLKERRNSVAALEARKMQLSAKQELIDECFQAAKDKLQNLDTAEYVQFIVDQIKDFKDKDGEILLNAADKERIGSALKSALAGTALKVSDETANIEGGCILKEGNISYNASLERLLDNAKTELTSEIAKELFK